MLQLRKAEHRGHFDHGWLNTYHTFSFAGYQDPEHRGFRSLRVINEDRVQPGRGFGTHSHREMEIISYVLAGALEHKDDMGNGSVLRAGEFQRMSAGTGVKHSEFNPSDTELVHFYQVWILPERQGIAPSYEQRRFPDDEKRGKLKLVASREGRDDSLTVHQDADVYLSSLERGQEVTHLLAAQRHVWLQVLRGHVAAGGFALEAGDGLAASNEAFLTIRGEDASEVMLFDLS